MHLKSTFGICADIVWNILSPDSKSSTHSIQVWYIYIHVPLKKISTKCREIDQSHESYGSYGSGLITFQVFVVSGPFLFRRSPRPQRCWRWGWIGGIYGDPNPRKGLYRLKATWDIIWIICILNKYRLIFIYIYICVYQFIYLHKYKYIFTCMASSLNSTKPRFLFLWHNPNFNGLKLGSWKWWEIVRIPFFQSLQVNFVKFGFWKILFTSFSHFWDWQYIWFVYSLSWITLVGGWDYTLPATNKRSAASTVG